MKILNLTKKIHKFFSNEFLKIIISTPYYYLIYLLSPTPQQILIIYKYIYCSMKNLIKRVRNTISFAIKKQR